MVLLKHHAARSWEDKYQGSYRVVGFPSANKVEVRDLMGKYKTVHIQDTKFILPADHVVHQIPDYTQFGRADVLELNLKSIPDLKWIRSWEPAPLEDPPPVRLNPKDGGSEAVKLLFLSAQ